MGENEERQIANSQPSEGLEPSEGFFYQIFKKSFPTFLPNVSDTLTKPVRLLRAINLVDNLPDWCECGTHIAHGRKTL